MKVTQWDVLRLLTLMVENEQLPREQQISIFRSDMDGLDKSYEDTTIPEHSEALVFATTERETLIKRRLAPDTTIFKFIATIWSWTRNTATVKITHFKSKDRGTGDMIFGFSPNSEFIESVSFAKGLAEKLNELQEGDAAYGDEY